MMQSKWNITVATPMGERSGVLELCIDGDTLTGSLSDGEHVVALDDGKIQGNRLSWSAKITKPMRLNFKFTATIDADRISGSARHMLGSAAFTGMRA